MLNQLAPLTTALVEEPVPGGTMRLGLDVRPEGVTFVAQLRLYARPGPDAETAGSQLEAHRGWAEGFLQRVSAQVQPAVLAGAGRVIAALADENARLREALAECVETCAEALGRAEGEGRSEGAEGEQARAWLALGRAREALGETRLLPG